MHMRANEGIAVGPVGVIGLNTLPNADGRLNGSAIVVRGHAIYTRYIYTCIHHETFPFSSFLFSL